MKEAEKAGKSSVVVLGRGWVGKKGWGLLQQQAEPKSGSYFMDAGKKNPEEKKRERQYSLH